MIAQSSERPRTDLKLDWVHADDDVVVEPDLMRQHADRPSAEQAVTPRCSP